MRIASRSRLGLRDALAASLSAIPLRWLEGIRSAYARAERGGFAFALARLALRLLRYRKLDRDIADFAVADAPAIRFANTDSIIVRRVYWYGRHGYEGEEIDLWCALCRRASRVVEIGANIGFYTVFGAKSAPHVAYLAVEPHPVSARILRRNLALNGLASVTVLEAAVAGETVPGTVELLTPEVDEDEAPTGAFVGARSDVIRWRARRKTKVKAVSAAEVVAGADLVKIDAEGLELEILSSVETALLDTKPDLLFEVLPEAVELRRFVSDLMERTPYRAFLPVAGRSVELSAGEIRAGEPARSYGVRDILLTARGGPPAAPGSTP